MTRSTTMIPSISGARSIMKIPSLLVPRSVPNESFSFSASLWWLVSVTFPASFQKYESVMYRASLTLYGSFIHFASLPANVPL